jgi:hypothetical protein
MISIPGYHIAVARECAEKGACNVMTLMMALPEMTEKLQAVGDKEQKAAMDRVTREVCTDGNMVVQVPERAQGRNRNA